MSHPQTLRRTRIFVGLAVGVFLLLLGLVIRAGHSSTVELNSRHPAWTAQITGTTGDVAQVWIWTPAATLRTNVSIPAELRLDHRHLLLQVRSAGNRVLDLNVVGTNMGSAHVQINVGETNSAEFLSFYRYPFLPLGGFTAGKLPDKIPLGVKPVYETPWAVYPSRYDMVTNLLTGN